ncbi:uncharacterized protein L969DRAFT_93336 [Mixia osmundae IAM 14324]|uniref:Uncharacterized protein n=1 Tax=Mixia osmundae (strain CBS 9802 / IAM 14324 / JCM 22182 / KY 12970) TaxID=764103 RepID=G7E5D4_MIXOS|nr:uncharacterized protein L969DRAFT_93336 [Mixia osmundae IAM 14324]KEI40804.1 hypothetical protein L969DRAFT_93336 [Mixia osmundae IAM 14324]GAA98044.1 hypothetical protein E5Q_04725 [Mixia osmundae IAM 14324]
MIRLHGARVRSSITDDDSGCGESSVQAGSRRHRMLASSQADTSRPGESRLFIEGQAAILLAGPPEGNRIDTVSESVARVKTDIHKLLSTRPDGRGSPADDEDESKYLLGESGEVSDRLTRVRVSASRERVQATSCTPLHTRKHHAALLMSSGLTSQQTLPSITHDSVLTA